jgi:5-methylcytosine-specific restriction endonuclease McrA
MEERTCAECGAALTKKPGGGRWPVRCPPCARARKVERHKEWMAGHPVLRITKPPKPRSWSCLDCPRTGTTTKPGSTPKRCPNCAKAHAVELRRQAQRRQTAANQAKPPKRGLCSFCGEVFEWRGHGGKYCGKTCGMLAASERRKAKVKNDPEYRARFLAAKYRLRDEHPHNQTCEGCGATYYRPATQPGRFCKRSCYESSKAWVCGSCLACGKSMVTIHGGRYCSSECDPERPRIGPAKRRRIFKRDGYVCHLCGELTLPDEPFPNLKAPTLDHVVPWSYGGSDEEENLKCACWSCNSARGNMLLSEWFTTHPMPSSLAA